MKLTKATAGIATAALSIAVLTGCGSQAKKDDDRCRTSSQPMFFGSDGHYHYGSPTGRVVPAASVPSSAQKVPGYKAPAAPKVDLNKTSPKAPPAAPKPVAPAPRPAAPKMGR